VNTIERNYQTFLKAGKPFADTYIEIGNGDVYYLVFRLEKYADGKPYTHITITNTGTQAYRDLKRKTKLNGPFIEVKATRWMITNPEDSDEEIFEADPQTTAVV
jgi:hypothetical protein